MAAILQLIGNRDIQHWFVASYDIGHLCYDQLTPVKTYHLLTRITCYIAGSNFRAHQDHMFFEVDC